MVVQQIPQQTQVQAAQAQALLAAGNAGSQANQQRNPFWNGMPGGPPPMLAAGLPGNFYPQMAAFAAAQENATAMVAVAKLGSFKGASTTNSSLVVRSSVRKFNVTGGILSVAQWTRKTVEENLEWLVNLSKRHLGNDKIVLLAYGDSCETLVFLDDHVDKMPLDFKKIKKVGVGVSMAQADSNLDETKLAKQGILQPSDSLWEHLRFETISAGDKKSDKCLFIHTNITVWSGGVEGRRRVLQVTTSSGLSFKPNPLFEQQVLSKWKEQGSGMPMTAIQEKETVITFNPKELLLLQKAFDNRLTSRDLKTNTAKFTLDDKKAAQHVIKRAQAEFVMRGPSRKRRKKEVPKPSTEAKKEEKPAPASKEQVKKDTKAKNSPVKKAKKDEKKGSKSTPSKKTKKEDDDDEPISKMVKKAEKTPAKKASRRSSVATSKDSKAETRGRPKVSKAKTKEEAPKKRSRSRSKK